MAGRTLTLDKGTWFDMIDSNDERIVAEIIDYEHDAGTNQHWFKCKIHFAFQDASLIGNIISLGARDFEGFPRLEIFDEREGKARADYFQRQAAQNETQETVLAEAEVQTFGDIIREAVSRPTQRDDIQAQQPEEQPETQEPQEERAYRSADTFRHVSHSSYPNPENYTIELGSGNMKTTLKLFDEAPEKIFPVINKVVEETGHLIMTYSGNKIRQKIIDHKVIFEKEHSMVRLEKGKVYSIEYRGKETIAKYLGTSLWVMHRRTDNNIPGMSGRTFLSVPPESFVDFHVQKVANQEHYAFENELQDIDPRWRDESEYEVYCKNPHTNPIRLDKKWQDAVIYNYIMGGTIPEDIMISQFEEKETIEELARIRNNHQILSLLTAEA